MAFADTKNAATFWKAFEELNVTKIKEGASGVPGVFWVADSIDPVLQTRSSARTAYYDPIVNRTNLHLLTGSYVKELILSNLTAEGVKIISRADNSTTLAFAKEEVILAAGAVHTPQILQLSGIGPASVLEAAGVDVLLDLPGVGANFQDHPVAYMSFNLTADESFPTPSSLSNNATYNELSYEEYITSRDGPYTMAHGNGAAFLPLGHIAPDSYTSIASNLAAQNASAYLPSIYASNPTLLAGFLAQRQIHVEQIQSTNASIYEFSFQGGGTATTALQKPISRGTIHLDPSDPFGEPIIDFQGLVNPADKQVIITAVKYTRKIFNTTTLSAFAPVEILPGAEYQTDAEIYSALAAGVAQPTFAHPSCTCAMLPIELGGVVASDLLVHGVGKLSVVDASIIPVIPATHLQATVYAIAEKAADIIKARANGTVY